MENIWCFIIKSGILQTLVTGCYQEEIAAQKGEWCEDNADEEEYLNICDGSKTDCVLKGKEKCHSDPNCHGIMWNGAWGPYHKGVMVCTTNTLIEKAAKDWSVYLKCNDEGKCFISEKQKSNIDRKLHDKKGYSSKIVLKTKLQKSYVHKKNKYKRYKILYCLYLLMFLPFDPYRLFTVVFFTYI